MPAWLHCRKAMTRSRPTLQINILTSNVTSNVTSNLTSKFNLGPQVKFEVKILCSCENHAESDFKLKIRLQDQGMETIGWDVLSQHCWSVSYTAVTAAHISLIADCNYFNIISHVYESNMHTCELHGCVQSPHPRVHSCDSAALFQHRRLPPTPSTFASLALPSPQVQPRFLPSLQPNAT